MTFLEALKSGRPMRRKHSTRGHGPYVVLGDTMVYGEHYNPWLRIDTGKEITLARWDYEADDWEIMP